jgi:DNA replication protein DnaC
MLNEQTVAILNSLKLFGMARGISERLTDPNHGNLSHADFVGLLVQDEKTYRDNQSLARLLKNAKLRQPAALEDIDFAHARGPSKQVMLELTNSQWIAGHRNVLITGPARIGKSYLSCALGNSAARAGYTTLYTRAPRLLESLQHARGDGSHLKLLDKLARMQLLVIDDFLLTPLSDWERYDIKEVAEGRYDAGSTVIASQCPVKDWHPAIGDPTLADAICDRLLHSAYRLELRADSMHRENAVKTGSPLEGKGDKPIAKRETIN